MDDRGMIVTDEWKRELMHHVYEITRHPVRCSGCMEKQRKISLEEWAASLGITDIHLKTGRQLRCEVYDFLALEFVETMRSELKKIKVKSDLVDMIS